MRKHIFIITIIALIANSCKKEKEPEPIAPAPAVEQMYCITFVHMPVNGEPNTAYDTVMRTCVTAEGGQGIMGLSYPEDYQASWLAQGINHIFVPQPVGDCIECN
jgi:hypothetical protein